MLNARAQLQRGFTLIEIMVSVTIFSIVMVISMGALLSISAADKKAETLKTVMSNLNFAVDSMSRSIRTGTVYDCGSGPSVDCPDGSGQLSFIPVDGGSMTYKLETSKTTCAQSVSLASGGCIMRSINGAAYQSITSPEVVITALKFYLIGSSPTDVIQSKVIMSVSGFIKVSGNPTSLADCTATPSQCSVFNLQTSVTQRLYDQ